jgi:hypothetical protein
MRKIAHTKTKMNKKELHTHENKRRKTLGTS